MSDGILLEIVTPEKLLLKEKVDELTAPGYDGEFGVLPGHTEFMTVLSVGEVSYKKDGETIYLAVSWGYTEVSNDKVIILAETAELGEHIDISRAEAKKREIEKVMSANELAEEEFNRAEVSLKKAVTRIQVASKFSEKGV